MIRGTNTAPKDKEDMHRLIHNVNCDILKDIKRDKITEGYVWMKMIKRDQTLGYPRYLANILETDDIPLMEGEKIVPVEEFVQYMNMKGH